MFVVAVRRRRRPSSILYHKDQPPERLIEQADGALYEAKRLGRNQVVAVEGDGEWETA